MKIRELYSAQNLQFRNYMKNHEVDIYNRWWEFALWAAYKPEVVGALEKICGREIDESDYDDIKTNINDLEPEVFFKLPKEIQEEFYKEFKESIATDIAQHNPSEAPTWSHMSLDRNNLLKRDTWLIHFTNEPYKIAEEGFTLGTDNMDQLGLTKWVRNKNQSGYNFAFEADSKYVRWHTVGRDKDKYGSAAVMFQSSGVKCHHFGDQEDQIVFWGEDVNPKSIIVLQRDYDDLWCVCVRSEKKKWNKNDPRDYVFRNEDIENVIQWVEKNYRQYAKVITGW